MNTGKVRNDRWKGCTSRISEIDAIARWSSSWESIEGVLEPRRCFACSPENGSGADVILKREGGKKMLQGKCRQRRRQRYL